MLDHSLLIQGRESCNIHMPENGKRKKKNSCLDALCDPFLIDQNLIRILPHIESWNAAFGTWPSTACVRIAKCATA